MMKNLKPNTNNLNRQVYLYIQNKIITNQLKPGSRINYEELAQEVGVSITPVRDALNWLQKDGFVEIKSRSGAFVKSLNYTDLHEIIHVRKALEREAVGLATPNIPDAILESLMQKTYDVDSELNGDNLESFIEADRELHRAIASYANNSRIAELLESLEAQSKWIGIILVEDRERYLQANNHHRDIIKAMMNRNVEAAQNHMDHHLIEIKKAMIRALPE